MEKIKIAELFYSVQGEGRYMGVPSVFMRTFGCNFRCKKFGRPRDEEIEGANPEVAAVMTRISEFKSYNELPLVSTGCDTYAAIYPEFKDLSPYRSPEEIVSDIMAMLPYRQWRDEHLVITGGEPLLAWQQIYPVLLSRPEMLRLKEITFETNGTQLLYPEFRHFLLNWTLNPTFGRRGPNALTFSVSAKLSCSGESREDAIRPDVVMQYQEVGHTYLKFVIAAEEDAEEALEVLEIYRREGFTGDVYLMPVGGVESVYSLNNRRVAELAMQHGLRYSDRLQVPLFKNEWGT
jgi:7-carboxy-7-deazaguanine synthase